MITNEKLDNICKKVINGEILTTVCLKDCGLNPNDIKKIVDNNFLVKVKRAEYELSNVDYLYSYSKRLSSLNDIENATKGFLTCYKINPIHSDTCIWLFIKSLIDEDFQNAFKYFEGFFESSDELEKKDNLFLLYMLSFITDIPDEYINDLQQIEFEIIKIKDESLEDSHLLNSLRYCSMHTKYKKAKKLLSEKKDNQGLLTMIDLATQILIEKAEKIHEYKMQKIKEFIGKKDYESIIELLDSNRKKEILGVENKLLNLAIIAHEIKTTEKIPKPIYVATENTDEAIKSNNFDLALKLAIQYNKKFNLKNKSNLVYLILSNIVNMINEIKNKKVQIEEKNQATIDNEDNVDKSALLEKQFISLRENGGILFLKSMKKEKRDILTNIIDSTEDIAYKEIGIKEPRRLVLIYAPNKNKYIEFNPIVKEADQLYVDASYKKSLEKYSILLESGNHSTYIFAKIGLCYLKINLIKKAIEYFTVATELSQELGQKYDFTELICTLKGIELDEDIEIKKSVKMKEEEFVNDVDDYYGIENIDRVSSLLSNGLTADEICNILDFKDEQKNILYLIFARECYIQNNFDLGDNYLKVVEKAPNKTLRVKNIMNYIMKNKKFFMNRDMSNHKVLVLERIKN